MSMTTCQAFILAGGASSRMGFDKVNAKIGTTRFVDHVANLCEKRNLNPTLLGRTDDARWPGIEDTEPGAGPLSALATGLQNTTKEALLIAVDMPLIAGADIDWLLAQPAMTTACPDDTEQQAQAIVPMVGTHRQWTFARYSQACLPIIQHLLAQQIRALHQLTNYLAISSPVAPSMTGDRLLNVNTPADLDYAESWFHQKGCACPEESIEDDS